MGFVGGGSGGFIGGLGGKVYKHKNKIFKVLNTGQSSFVLSGVVGTDVLSIYDQYGVPWAEPENYARSGQNLDTITFLSPMVDTVSFTVYVYE